MCMSALPPRPWREFARGRAGLYGTIARNNCTELRRPRSLSSTVAAISAPWSDAARSRTVASRLAHSLIRGRGPESSAVSPVALRRLRKDFEPIGDFGGFAKHGGYRAVFILAQFDGVAAGFFFQAAREAVDHFDFGPHGRRVFGAFAGNFDLEGGEFLSVFFEDQDDAHGGAGTH